jgi:outer membrane receptor for ferrienterochelin and colicins
MYNLSWFYIHGKANYSSCTGCAPVAACCILSGVNFVYLCCISLAAAKTGLILYSTHQNDFLDSLLNPVMKKTLLICIVLLITCICGYTQLKLSVSVKNAKTKEPLAGATITIKAIKKSISADSSGSAVFPDLAAGTYNIQISFVGFEEQLLTVTVQQPGTGELQVLLTEAAEAQEEEVIVQATRTSRTIANTPTRIEVISGEELDEKANMKPGDIRMMLSESTGIQTQQTSATSYNSSIRIQGLDGRYTQILRDGYPLYGGFSGGLSIMQIAPLDLRQVEVIKGSSSTLYGGGAIAGLVNLVSKTPTEERELSFLANATSAKGLDLSNFYSQRFGKLGVTVFGSRNSGSPYDPADIGLTAIPKFERYTINPRLFVYGKNTTANVGLSYITEDRIGGSMDYIKKDLPGYFEKNNTDRLTGQVGFAHRFAETSTLTFKGSYTRFKRGISIPTYVFEGLQQSTFSELAYNKKGPKSDWILGANILTDNFAEEPNSNNPLRDYHFNTFGAFVQNAWSPGNFLTIESGLRADYVDEYGMELLPRLSAMFRFSPKITVRVGGGMGYKTPTVFTEESERYQMQGILPIDINATENERSIGGNLDFNYRVNPGEFGLSINQLFFYTNLKKPLLLTTTASGEHEFRNANGHIDTKGFETNVKLTYGDFKLFVGYTYADVNNHFDGLKTQYPLTARHRLNNVLMYEMEDEWKLGLEGYYVSKQLLNDGETGKSYWMTGFMAEKLWEKFSLYINFENFTDTRQTRFDTIYTGPVTDPTFRDIYAPVDGFVINGGIKLRL